MYLLRLPEVRNKIGRSRSSIYLDVGNKLLPPPIKNGLRSSAWISTELDAVLEARIAGKSDDEIKMLVERMVKARTAQLEGG